MKKPVRSLALLLACVILLTGLPGCLNPSHTKDPTKEYRGFLNYTAGSKGWKVVDKGQGGYDYLLGLGHVSYKYWTVRFKDIQGEPLEVTINNENLSAATMLRDMLRGAEKVVERELRYYVEDIYAFDQEEWLGYRHLNQYKRQVDPDSWLSVHHVVNTTNMWPHLLSAEDGLRLCDVTAETLLCQQDWYVSLRLLGCNAAELDDYLTEANALYQSLCDYVGTPVNAVFSLPVRDEGSLKFLTLAWYNGEEVSQQVDAVREQYKDTPIEKYDHWFYNKRYPEERYTSDWGPALYNYHRIAVERGLDKEELLEIYQVYQQIFEEYLLEQLPLEQCDQLVQQQVDKDGYQGGVRGNLLELSTLGLEYICVLNFYHVERLSDEQLDTFRRHIRSGSAEFPQKLQQIVLDTYPLVIAALSEEELLERFPDEETRRWQTNNVSYQNSKRVGNYDLYIAIMANKSISGDGRQERLEFFDTLTNALSAEANDALDCSVYVGMY